MAKTRWIQVTYMRMLVMMVVVTMLLTWTCNYICTPNTGNDETKEGVIVRIVAGKGEEGKATAGYGKDTNGLAGDNEKLGGADVWSVAGKGEERKAVAGYGKDTNSLARNDKGKDSTGRKTSKKSTNLSWNGKTEEDSTVAGAEQGDRALVEHIRRRLIPPSTLPYNLTNPNKEDFSQFGQTKFLQGLLDDKKGGFFVEAGAANGEYLSNTLYLERRRDWTGLLVEALPSTFSELLGKHRKAHVINAALSFTQRAAQVSFRTKDDPVLGHIDYNVQGNRRLVVQAYPLYSILLALNVTTIDFFSLDIEGGELKVLKTVPWDKVRVDVLCVESNLIPEGEQALIHYMQDQGYHYLGTRGIDAWFTGPDYS